jgi:hypothetical protein
MNDLLSQISLNITNAVQNRLENALELAPFVLGATAVFLVGFILAELAHWAIIKLSERLKLEFISEKIGLKHFLERTKAGVAPSHAIAKAVKGYLIFLFLIEATKVAKLTQVAQFLTKIINYIPEVLIALFILLIGIRIGTTLEAVIKTSMKFAKASTAEVLGIAAKFTMVAFAILAALTQLEIAEILINTLFIGFVAMLALAGGLAFGLGGKDVVKELLEAIKAVEIKKERANHKKKK